MSSMFSGPPAPPPVDPKIAQMQKEEQKRAEMERRQNLSDQLRVETQLRNRRTGVRGLLFGGGGGLTSLLGSG